ncbi:MAG: hypothetical protein KGI50_05880 [Patescibacteria group bacterium]|nr:hypothetical protein [Patescibacteria group bacterium]MDE2438805.1 hypothetical protein [Patescibacteria group bacterium]
MSTTALIESQRVNGLPTADRLICLYTEEGDLLGYARLAECINPNNIAIYIHKSGDATHLNVMGKTIIPQSVSVVAGTVLYVDRKRFQI